MRPKLNQSQTKLIVYSFTPPEQQATINPTLPSETFIKNGSGTKLH
jgi:hypothetical protein